ncbi:P-type conjugative transfer protein TrbJ [soil metagenome]
MTAKTRFARSSIGKYWAGPALGIAAFATVGLPLTVSPAHAQLTVFDPRNYVQSILTAARALQQINNQIRSLQNQATMLTNMAKNLSRIDFPELQQLRGQLQQIDRLMGQAQGISFQVSGTNAQFQQLFPQIFNQALTGNQQVIASRARMDTAMAAFRQSMSVQSQVVGNVQADIPTLSSLAEKSQSAEGALQAQQATNQLLALTAKQQFQIQNLMAAQYRADAIEQARRVQGETDARAATTKFLGSGSAYTPQ